MESDIKKFKYIFFQIYRKAIDYEYEKLLSDKEITFTLNNLLTENIFLRKIMYPENLDSNSLENFNKDIDKNISEFLAKKSEANLNFKKIKKIFDDKDIKEDETLYLKNSDMKNFIDFSFYEKDLLKENIKHLSPLAKGDMQNKEINLSPFSSNSFNNEKISNKKNKSRNENKQNKLENSNNNSDFDLIAIDEKANKNFISKDIDYDKDLNFKFSFKEKVNLNIITEENDISKENCENLIDKDFEILDKDKDRENNYKDYDIENAQSFNDYNNNNEAIDLNEKKSNVLMSNGGNVKYSSKINNNENKKIQNFNDDLIIENNDNDNDFNQKYSFSFRPSNNQTDEEKNSSSNNNNKINSKYAKSDKILTLKDHKNFKCIAAIEDENENE